MKKVKILTIVLIVTAILVGISYSVFGGNDNRTKLEIGENQSTQDLGYGDMLSKYNNIYCIEHGQSMNEVRTYNIKTKIVIKGNIAEIYTNQNGSYQLEETVDNKVNNVMAAILTDGSVDGKEGIVSESKYTYGYKVNDKYSDAQYGLYQYLSTWVDAIDASKYGFEGAHRALTGDAATIASAVIAQAQAKAEEYCYSVTIYLLYRPVNYYQSLIVTDPENPVPLEVNVPVTKIWLDGENKYNTRPQDITVRLLANGVICQNEDGTEKIATLNEKNDWKYTFEGLDVYDENDQKIQYTIEEINVSEKYTSSISGDMNIGYAITNREKTELKVIKNWKDENNLDDLRPTEITVKLLINETVYKNEDGTDKTVTLKESEGWTASFTDLYRCDLDGNEIKYTVQEEVVAGYDEPLYDKTISEDGTIIYTVTNSRKPNYNGYIEITGKVWLDKPDTKSNQLNGVLDNEENGLGGIKVTLKDANGNQFDATSTTITKDDGTYIIKVNYDNTQNVYKLYENSATVTEKLKTAYVEFEYDAFKYTTVATAQTGANTSKAVEDENARNNFDNTYSKITSPTIHPNDRIDNYITAVTKSVISFETYTDTTTSKIDEVIKYCNGANEYKQTNPYNEWENIITGQHSCLNCKEEGHTLKTFKVDVETIQNVNLGLFEREQPRIELGSDVNRVIVEMNGQDYTYLYRNRGIDSDGMKVKYEGNDYYTNSQEYMRPVNVSDVAYMLNKAEEVLKIYVVYELNVANTSNSVEIKVDDIINFYDPEYELISVTNVGKQGNPKQEELTNYETGEGEGYKTVTLKGLNLILKAGETSDKIEIKYKVNKDTIIKLLQEQATLEHVSEILSYTNTYGITTLYAEQRTHETEVEKGLTGRGGTPYAGYDYEAQPGNAEIYYHQEWNILRSKQAEEAYIAKNGKGIESKAQKAEEQACAEHDTDFAPSFILKVGDAKTLSGTVYEDKDVNLEDEERLGNGKFDEGEKTVGNVKVELYNIDGTIATLYETIEATGIPAVTYTDENGNYALKGVVTSEYFVKFTYGDDAEKLGHEATTIDGTTTINARNYKSTIITNEKLKEIFGLDYSNERYDKNWHINIEDNHSVAVDNMLERTEIKDLQYSNFGEKLNMTAYTKPFSTEVEFDADGEGQSDKNGDIGISNVLSKLDFGIVERPREDLFVEKTIKYMKLVLANGQTLIDGDPRSHTLNYAKAIGFDQEITSGEAARRANPKRLLIEMDVELIQGSKLELQYEIKVTNNNELDYDYGTSADYTDIVIAENKFITTSDKAKYYYFGEKAGLNEMKATIEFVDYLSSDITYEEDTAKWKPLNENDLIQEGNELVSAETYETIKDSKYKVFTSTDTSVTLSRKETCTQDMTVSKSLANKEENVYENSLEILKIDGKTARTIQEADINGKQIEKTYKPGNYIPASGKGEQDDDFVDVIITPPTGISAFVITYLITGVVGLTVIALVIIFIKKKGLTK